MTKLTMLLAQAPGLPNGDIEDKLILSMALTSQGQIDVDAYHGAAAPWLATRQRNGGEPRQLEVVRLDEGWALQSVRSEDDPLWTFEGHVFRPGELVRLRRPNGDEMLFRIVAVESD